MTQLVTRTKFAAQRCDGDDGECPGMEEQREASLPVGDDEVVAGAEDKSIVVLLTEELTPVSEVSTATMDVVMETLSGKSDWLELYEAVVTLRRIVVHHAEVVTTQQIDAFLRPLAMECDSLRSAPSKNGLLAYAECFQFLSRSMLEQPLLGGAHSEVLDVLLRRSACEKKFLRDAAALATHQLATHFAGLPLLAACARYGTNKNGKLCGTAARVFSSSLSRLQEDQGLVNRGSGSLRPVYKALAAFQESKDAGARSEATTSFRKLGEIIGLQEFELGLKDAFPGANQSGVIARILKDASRQPSHAKARIPRTGSLRERMTMKAN